MTRFARFLIRFYPAAWRKRYGDEFDALLIDTRPDVAILFDLLKGALRMQFSTWSFPRLAVSLGLLGAIIGFGVSLLQPRNYVASATLHITGSDSPHDAAQLLQRELTTRQSIASLIQDVGLYPEQRRTQPIEEVIENMRTRDLTIAVPTAGSADNAISISFRYPDEAVARNAVRKIASRLSDRPASVSILLADAGRYIPSIDVLDGPDLPMYLDGLRNPDYLPFIGALVGFIVAAILFLRPRRRKFYPLRWTAAGFILGLGLPAAISIVLLGEGDLPAGQLLESRSWLLFRSSATLLVPEGYAGSMSDLVAALKSRSTLAQVMQDPHLRLYEQDRRTQPLEDIVARMQRNLSIKPGPTIRKLGFPMTPLEFSFAYSDSRKTQQTIQVLMGRLDDLYMTRVRANWGVKEGISVNLKTAAGLALPPMPHSSLGTIDPNVPITILTLAPDALPPARAGLLIGLALATIIGLVRRRLIFAAEDLGADPSTRLIRFSGSRFRKLAIILPACGILLGALEVWHSSAVALDLSLGLWLVPCLAAIGLAFAALFSLTGPAAPDPNSTPIRS